MNKFNTKHQLQSAPQYLAKLSDAYKLRRYREVIEIIEFAPKKLKNNPEVLAYLAIAHKKTGTPWNALPLYKKAIPKSSSSLLFLNNLATLYLQLGRPDEAVTWARKSFALGPHDLKLQATLLECLIGLGNTDEAKRMVLSCIDADGANNQSLLTLSRIQYFEGEFEDAASTCRTLIKSDYRSGEVYLRLFESLDLRANVPEKDIVETMCKRKEIPTNDRILYLRAMALYHDSNGDFDEAFRYYKLIGDSKHVRDGERPLREKLQHIKRTITPEFIEKFREAGDLSAKPIFVVGMPRSGTSLTEQILCSHPKIGGAGELDYFAIEELRFAGNHLASNGNPPIFDGVRW